MILENRRRTIMRFMKKYPKVSSRRERKGKEDDKYFGEFHPSRTANILLLLVVDKGLKED